MEKYKIDENIKVTIDENQSLNNENEEEENDNNWSSNIAQVQQNDPEQFKLINALSNPSNNTFAYELNSFFLYCILMLSATFWNLINLAFVTLSLICFKFAEGVPGLGLKINEKKFMYSTCCIKSNVSSKSLSVSPG